MHDRMRTSVACCESTEIVQSVLSCGYAHTQLRWFYLGSTFGASHVRKNTRLSMPVQLQCSHSGVWEPGNEANQNIKTSAICLPNTTTSPKMYTETTPPVLNNTTIHHNQTSLYKTTVHPLITVSFNIDN